MAAGKASVTATEAAAKAAMAAAPTAMAATATAAAGEDVAGSQNQKRACERNANRTVHGNLLVTGVSLPRRWSPLIPTANRAIPRVSLDQSTERPHTRSFVSEAL
jgi:hypothetical protein